MGLGLGLGLAHPVGADEHSAALDVPVVELHRDSVLLLSHGGERRAASHRPSRKAGLQAREKGRLPERGNPDPVCGRVAAPAEPRTVARAICGRRDAVAVIEQVGEAQLAQHHLRPAPEPQPTIWASALALVDGHCAPTTVERAGERQTRRTGAGYQDAGWCHVTVG